MKQTLVLGLLTLLGGPAMLSGPGLAAESPYGGSHGAGDAALCQSAIRVTEQNGRLPAKLLSAIGLIESGRPDPQTGLMAPWPWTINVAGIGYFFPTKTDVIAAVQSAQLAGVQSIDVGCMQVNLLHHPHAFSSLQEAFDPLANATYAATFLQQLHSQTNDWGAAAIGYHSFTPELGAEYGQRLATVWPLAASYGLPMPGESAKSRDLAARMPVIDPYKVLTPEFRAQLVSSVASRRALDIKMRSGTAVSIRPPELHQTNSQHMLRQQVATGRPGRPAFF